MKGETCSLVKCKHLVNGKCVLMYCRYEIDRAKNKS